MVKMNNLRWACCKQQKKLEACNFSIYTDGILLNIGVNVLVRNEHFQEMWTKDQCLSALITHV